jgi:hypothetical protein
MTDQLQFNDAVGEFHVHLAEEKFDNAIHVMFALENYDKGGGVRGEVVGALKIKLKDAMLTSLRNKLRGDKIDESFVMWEKCKLMSYGDDAAKVYANAMKRRVIQSVDVAASQLRASREILAGDVSSENQPHVEALTMITNRCALLTSQMQPLGEKAHTSDILTSIHEIVEPFVLKIIRLFEQDRQLKELSTRMRRASMTKQEEHNSNNIEKQQTIIHKKQKKLTNEEIDRLDVLLHEVALIGQVLHNYLRLLSSENVSETKTRKLTQRMQELVVINFVSLESQFMRYCVRVALDTAEMTQLDETRNFSTANLDCFYVIKRSVDRALFTMNLIAIVNILSEVVSVIQDMFSSHIISSLRSAMKASVDDNSSSSSKELRKASLDADEDELARALGEALQVEFEVSDRVLSELNTLDIASLNIESMESELRKRADLMIRKKSDRERFYVLLTELQGTAKKLEANARNEAIVLCNRTIRDKIVRIFQRARMSGKLNFEIGDEEFAQSQSCESFANDLMKKLFMESAMIKFRSGLTSRTLRYVIERVVEILNSEILNLVMQTHFTAYGAIRLSQEIRQFSALCNVSELEGEKKGLRSMWTRLRQVSFLLNLEHAQDAYEYTDPKRTFTASQIRQILLRRKDFRGDVVERLRLETKLSAYLRS